MWIMAVDTGHCPLGKPVRMGFPEFSPSSRVAARALLVDLTWFAHDDAV
jgi:hypothetical protein